MTIQELTRNGDLAAIREALESDPSLAHAGIALDTHGPKASPLHRLADAVAEGLITDQQAVLIAQLYLDAGADINGGILVTRKDTPLIAACSLGADQLALFYIEKGADIHHAGTHGGTALHWAGWCGKPVLVKALLAAGALANQRCIDFQSTPLRWTQLGFERSGNREAEYGECEKLLEGFGV